MASVIRSRLLLILAITSLAISAPAAALADCLGGGGGGTWEWEWGEGGGGSGGTGGSGGGSGGGGTTTGPVWRPLSQPFFANGEYLEMTNPQGVAGYNSIRCRTEITGKTSSWADRYLPADMRYWGCKVGSLNGVTTTLASGDDISLEATQATGGGKGIGNVIYLSSFKMQLRFEFQSTVCTYTFAGYQKILNAFDFEYGHLDTGGTVRVSMSGSGPGCTQSDETWAITDPYGFWSPELATLSISSS